MDMAMLLELPTAELEAFRKYCDLELKRRRIDEELRGTAEKQLEIVAQRKTSEEEKKPKVVATPLRSRLQSPIGSAPSPPKVEATASRKRPRPPDGPPSLRAFEEAWKLGYD